MPTPTTAATPENILDRLTQYVFNNFTQTPPTYHVIQDDVSSPLQRLKVETVTGHQSRRSRRGVIAVTCETHWTGHHGDERWISSSLNIKCCHIRLGWHSGTAHRQTSRLYGQVRIGAAERNFSRATDERRLASGYRCVPCADWSRRYSTTVLPNGAYLTGVNPPTAYRGKGNSTLVQLPTGNVSCVFWTTRERSDFRSLHDFDRRDSRLKVSPIRRGRAVAREILTTHINVKAWT